MGEEKDSASLNKVSIFSGRKEDFQQWWLGFYTHITLLGVTEALEKDFGLPANCLEESLSYKESDKWTHL